MDNSPAAPVKTAIAATAALALGCASGASSATVNDRKKGVDIDTSFLEQYAATYRFRLGRPGAIQLAPEGDVAFFLRSGPRSFVSDLYAHDVRANAERLVASAESLLGGAEEALDPEEKARRERMRMVSSGIAGYVLSKDGKRLLVSVSGRTFVLGRDGTGMKEIRSDAGPAIDPTLSPDGRKVACVRRGDLYVHDVESGAATRLTVRAGEGISNGLAEFVAQEEMSRPHGYWWSPDGSAIAYQQTDDSGVEVLHIMDPADPARAPEAWPYPRAGKRNAGVRLGIVPVAGGATTWVEWDRERYPYLVTVRWQNGAPLTVVVEDRLQQEMAILAADPASGVAEPIHVELDPAWIDIDQDVPRWLPGGEAFLWTSDRSGARSLEIRARDGKLVRTVTGPGLLHRGLVHVDEDGKGAVVRASEVATEVHLYRIALDGSAPPRRLTEGAGEHAAAFSRDGATWVHATDPASGDPAWLVRDAAGAALGELASAAERPPFSPRYELTDIEVDGRLHHAAIIRPRSAAAGAKLPVIVHVYGGPSVQMVAATASRYVFDQWIADHGFAVISIDARGTPGRGREWSRAIRGNFIAVPLADQAAVIEALFARMPELDRERVGIYGWSFGGYFSAMAVMLRPDLFHAGVAGAPVADWLDYDTHYTERYMGLPAANPSGYADSSVLTHAPKLERPLLIVHGTADDNVYFTHAIKMSDALFRAGKPHAFLPLAGLTHMVPDPLVAVRLHTRVLSFFVDNLL